MRKLIAIVMTAGAGVLLLYGLGWLRVGSTDPSLAAPKETQAPRVKAQAGRREEAAPAVTVAKAYRRPIRETVLVTGTLVARLEVLVAPEVEGLRVTELLVEEGARVKAGEVIARLEKETLSAQLAQSDATLARSAAAIAQARSSIVAAEARKVETANALERAKPLGKTGVISESTLDQRESAAQTAAAQLRSAEDGLKLAEAERLQIEAQRRDIIWKLSRADVRAPVSGIVSRRTARIGAVASGAAVAQPMFHLIADGDVELEADVPEIELARLAAGMPATITAMGKELQGKVRLVSPEVDKASRLGRVRISLADDPALKIGAFGRGTVLVRSGEGTAVPASAVLYGTGGAYVQAIEANRVVSRKVEIGMQGGDVVEIASGLAPGDVVVARSGTFFRAGDLVTPVDQRIETAR